MPQDYVSFLPVDNGDSIIIKAGGNSVLTDIHCRKDDDAFDITPEIKASCNNNKLDYFVVTHTDKDHVRGFDEIFYRGTPANWSESKFILVKTIICSQYVIDLKNPTAIAKPLVNEIRRRNKLEGADRKKDGNKLIIVGDGDSISVNTNLKGYVLSPSQTELDNADPKADQDSESNNTSLVIRWEYQQPKGVKTNIMLGGDSEHEVWNRLNKEKKDSELVWNLITAPHHCSLTPFAYKEADGGSYKDDDGANKALGHRNGKGFVVASSKPIKRNSDNPPHFVARNKWLAILKTGEQDTPEKRFFCTATNGSGDTAAIVKFEINGSGVKRFVKAAVLKSSSSAGLDRTTRYGK